MEISFPNAFMAGTQFNWNKNKFSFETGQKILTDQILCLQTHQNNEKKVEVCKAVELLK